MCRRACPFVLSNASLLYHVQARDHSVQPIGVCARAQGIGVGCQACYSMRELKAKNSGEVPGEIPAKNPFTFNLFLKTLKSKQSPTYNSQAIPYNSQAILRELWLWRSTPRGIRGLGVPGRAWDWDWDWNSQGIASQAIPRELYSRGLQSQGSYDL
ncbi:hypothetical protein T492DRAFT_1118439 [Pavlovales sp. CCMP2436]|nr:hypothetical protein T492DRAFT_1118439 [Pavlovales sp. CCMP2436]